MNTEMLSYIKKDSPIHKLTGATKLICFLLWTIAAMITYDTRVLIGLFIAGIIVFKISKIKFEDVSFILYFILFFLLFFYFCSLNLNCLTRLSSVSACADNSSLVAEVSCAIAELD